MNFFEVQTEAIKKIYVPIRNVKTDNLKAIFSDYSNPPTLNEIKEACRKDGRPEEEIRKMNLPSLKILDKNPILQKSMYCGFQ